MKIVRRGKERSFVSPMAVVHSFSAHCVLVDFSRISPASPTYAEVHSSDRILFSLFSKFSRVRAIESSVLLLRLLWQCEVAVSFILRQMRTE